MLNFYNSALDRANINTLIRQANLKTRGKPNHKGWLSILCPFHNDENFGSCSINIETGAISCFVCGSHHINQLIDTNKNFHFLSNTEVKKEVKKQPVLYSNSDYNFIKKQVDPEDFLYTKEREFTNEFCDYFKVCRCFSFPYSDYFTTLVKDKSKNITAIEFRKLKEHEYLQKFFDDYTSTRKELKSKFKDYKIENKIEFKNYKVIKDGKQIDNDELLYLLQPKVKYETNSRIKETLWNINNLDYSKPLFLVEGIGSLPKIWTHISKNCTCTFGSKITEDQLIYLRKFLTIIVIPDKDEAGFLMTNALYLDKNIKELFVIDIDLEDTDSDYIYAIKNTNKMRANIYLSKSIMRYVKSEN